MTIACSVRDLGTFHVSLYMETVHVCTVHVNSQKIAGMFYLTDSRQQFKLGALAICYSFQSIIQIFKYLNI